jgi:hypothetical protein
MSTKRIQEGYQPKSQPAGDELRKGYQPQAVSPNRGTPPSGGSSVKPPAQADKPGK